MDALSADWDWEVFLYVRVSFLCCVLVIKYGVKCHRFDVIVLANIICKLKLHVESWNVKYLRRNVICAFIQTVVSIGKWLNLFKLNTPFYFSLCSTIPVHCIFTLAHTSTYPYNRISYKQIPFQISLQTCNTHRISTKLPLSNPCNRNSFEMYAEWVAEVSAQLRIGVWCCMLHATIIVSFHFGILHDAHAQTLDGN